MVMKTMGERVADAREANGWSQSELARRIGVKQQAIQQIESGETKRSRYLADIARETGFNLEWIVNGIGPERPDSFTPEERALVEKYRHMSEQDRKTLQEVGSALASKADAKEPVGNDRE